MEYEHGDAKVKAQLSSLLETATAGDSISLVLLRSIGDSFTRAVPLDELEEFITFS